MPEEKNPLNEVIQQTATRLRDAVKYIREYQSLPLGKDRMNPRQVKQKYGISVTEIRRLQNLYGEQVVNEALKALEGMGGLK